MRIKTFIIFILLFSTFAETRAEENAGDRIDTTTLTQLESIKEQLRSLRGEIEQLQFENSKLNEKLTKHVADTELRFNELNKNSPLQKTENNISSNSSPNVINHLLKDNEPQTINTPKNIKPVSKDLVTDKKAESNAIQKRYQEAYALIKSKEYKGAKDALEKFVTDYPNTELAGNAYYWLGEIHFQKAEYNKAAVNYLKGYQASTKGSRASDNLLKLAKMLAKLEKKKEACTTLNKLKKEFPAASSTIQKQMQEDIKKLQCGE